MPSERDPRVDPRPGDEVMFGPQWQLERYFVLGVKDRTVQYQMGPTRAVLTCRLNEWREWAKGGEVLRVCIFHGADVGRGGAVQGDPMSTQPTDNADIAIIREALNHASMTDARWNSALAALDRLATREGEKCPNREVS